VHHLLGGHTLWEAWQAVRTAVPNDGLVPQVVGYLGAVGSDLSSVIGLPLVTISKGSYEAVKRAAANLGIPRSGCSTFRTPTRRSCLRPCAEPHVELGSGRR